MNDYRQWPTIVKVLAPVWFPLFLLVAVVFYYVQLLRKRA